PRTSWGATRFAAEAAAVRMRRSGRGRGRSAAGMAGLGVSLLEKAPSLYARKSKNIRRNHDRTHGVPGEKLFCWARRLRIPATAGAAAGEDTLCDCSAGRFRGGGGAGGDWISA